MKSITVQSFVILGVVFLIIVSIGIYLFVADPYGMNPLPYEASRSAQDSNATVVSTENASTTDTPREVTTSSGFKLSSAQVEAISALGVDPASVPQSINAEQEACFIETLGEVRVEEIKSGAVPNTVEFLKAKSCL